MKTCGKCLFWEQADSTHGTCEHPIPRWASLCVGPGEPVERRRRENDLIAEECPCYVEVEE